MFLTLFPGSIMLGLCFLSNIWRELNGGLSQNKCSNKMHHKSRDEGTRHVLTPGIQPKVTCADITAAVVPDRTGGPSPLCLYQDFYSLLFLATDATDQWPCLLGIGAFPTPPATAYPWTLMGWYSSESVVFQPQCRHMGPRKPVPLAVDPSSKMMVS